MDSYLQEMAGKSLFIPQISPSPGMTTVIIYGESDSRNNLSIKYGSSKWRSPMKATA
jgi:hypothetical protein